MISKPIDRCGIEPSERLSPQNEYRRRGSISLQILAGGSYCAVRVGVVSSNLYRYTRL